MTRKDAVTQVRRVAIVTGAGRGVGAETARVFLAMGYHVIAAVRSISSAHALTGHAGDFGDSLVTVEGDLADLEFAHSLVDAAKERFGRLDVLINNAAWRELATMRTVSAESWDRTLRVCLTTPAFLSRWAAELMEPQRSGTILNVSSIEADRSSGMAPQYVVAKGGLDALTRDLAVLYGPSGIRVVSVRPGALVNHEDDYRTPEGASTLEARSAMVSNHVPLRRRGTPNEIAKVLAWLASEDATYISGSIITIDGGWAANLTPYDIKRLTLPNDFPD